MAENKKKKQEQEMLTTLEFDDGKTRKCIMEGVFDSDGQDYIALLPKDDSDDVYIYKYIEDKDGDYRFEDETDQERFKKAVAEYESFKGYKAMEENND